MPIYDYVCESCGHPFEALVARPGATAPCPACGSEKVARGVSCPGAVRSGGASSPRSDACSPGG